MRGHDVRRGKPLNPLGRDTARTRCAFQAPLPARDHRGVRPLLPAGPLASPHDCQGRPACQTSLTLKGSMCHKARAHANSGTDPRERRNTQRKCVMQAIKCMHVEKASQGTKTKERPRKGSKCKHTSPWVHPAYMCGNHGAEKTGVNRGGTAIHVGQAQEMEPGILSAHP